MIALPHTAQLLGFDAHELQRGWYPSGLGRIQLMQVGVMAHNVSEFRNRIQIFTDNNMGG